MTWMTPRIAAVTAVATLGLGGCSADQPPVCDSLAAVQTTMHHIRDANVAENGLTSLTTQLRQLQVEVRQLLTDAAAQWAPEVQAVRTAADQVSATVAAARETPDVAHVSAVRTAMGTLQTGLRSLGDAMSGTC
ncbi:hypothetical protein ACPCHT_08775 [Nucisporomicrobium flavum]|uniref:hypothetical protein n=1 Tax=Nucisporomicrobium flavum TaxID=2785915 RepID=UPI0018F2C2BF|nr:hypothetical protein [Nucisporomicrobium flavum]